MAPRWTVVDKLVHELGSLRAVVQELETEPEVTDTDVGLELRNALARAADTVHLVIGGDEAMLAQASQTIAEAQEVGVRARAALERSRAAGDNSRVPRERARASGRPTAQRVDLRDTSATRPAAKGADKQPTAAPRAVPRAASARPRPR